MQLSWKAGLAGLAFGALSMAPALAQTQTQTQRDFSGMSAQQIFQLCLDESEDDGECIGVWADNCNDQGTTTDAALRCLEPEVAYWNSRMEGAFRELKGALSAEDVDPNYPLANQIEVVQSAWSQLRGAECAFVRMTYQGGSEGNVEYQSCMLSWTAGRTLDLEDLWQAPQTQP